MRRVGIVALLFVVVAGPGAAQPASDVEEQFRRRIVDAYPYPEMRAAADRAVDMLLPAAVLPVGPPAPGAESANLVFTDMAGGIGAAGGLAADTGGLEYSIGTVTWRFIDNGPASVVDARLAFSELELHLWFEVAAPGAIHPIYELGGEYVGALLDGAELVDIGIGGRLLVEHRVFAQGWEFPVLTAFQDIESLASAEAITLFFALPDGAPHAELTIGFLIGATGKAAFAAARAAWQPQRP
jgi:hypothetical protein